MMIADPKVRQVVHRKLVLHLVCKSMVKKKKITDVQVVKMRLTGRKYTGIIQRGTRI